jgi:predicted transcriptional regulator of viral defense system
MNYKKLQKLKGRFSFCNKDLQNLLKLTPESARVIASRHTKDGFFIRLKRDFYVLNENWEHFSFEDFLKAANLILSPSYISFLTALSFYKLIPQGQGDIFESVSLSHSLKTKVDQVTFKYSKLCKKSYFGFIKKGEIFIATPEKAFVDLVYLYSFGKYKYDLSSINVDAFDKNRLKGILKAFPENTRKIAGKLCGIKYD